MMIREISLGRWLLVAFLLTLVTFLTTSAAFAGEAGPFQCVNGSAVGSLYSSDIVCPVTLSSDNIFSFLVCNMEQLSSNLMGNMFCGMVLGLAPAVQGVLVLACIIFGIGFTIGVIPATAREFQVFLLKVACVWMFATQSELLLDVGYKLLVNGIRDGVAIALGGYSTPNGDTQPLVYSQLDAFLGQMIRFATEYIGVDRDASITNGCKNALFAVMAVMALAFPPIFFLALALIMRITITFLRAIFGYVYALVGIAFLLTLAPFFLSFYLFRQTRPFFEKWMGYLISFTLQIVILFAFLAFILSVNNAEEYDDLNGNGRYDGPEQYTDSNNNGSRDNTEPYVDANGNNAYDATGETFRDISPHNGKRDSGLGADITDIVMPVAQVKEGGSFRMPWDYCTVCDFEVYTPTGANNQGPTVAQKDYSRVLRTGKLRCIDYRDNTKYPPPKPKDMDLNTGRIPITVDTSVSPKQSTMNALLQFAGAGLIALLVMVYILESLLAYVGSLAQVLAGGFGGATYAPQLGGGMSPGGRPTVDIPGGGVLRDFEAGMDEGFARRATTGNSLGAFAAGVKSGIERAVEGKGQKNAEGSNIKYDPRTGEGPTAGFKNRFIDWLVDPNHIDRTK